MSKKSYSRKGTRIKSSYSKAKRSAGKRDLKAFVKAISERFQNDSEE